MRAFAMIATMFHRPPTEDELGRHQEMMRALRDIPPDSGKRIVVPVVHP